VQFGQSFAKNCFANEKNLLRNFEERR